MPPPQKKIFQHIFILIAALFGILSPKDPFFIVFLYSDPLDPCLTNITALYSLIINMHDKIDSNVF